MIDKKAAAALRTLPADTLSKIKDAGELLKDTKYYHAKINENLEARLVSENNPYFGLFRTERHTTHLGEDRKVGNKVVQAENIVIVNDKSGLSNYGIAKYETEGVPRYNVWGAHGIYNRAGEVGEIAKAAKILDDVAIQKAAEAAENKSIAAKLQAKIDNEVDDLMSKFGV
jgi:hypothetical protein